MSTHNELQRSELSLSEDTENTLLWSRMITDYPLGIRSNVDRPGGSKIFTFSLPSRYRTIQNEEREVSLEKLSELVSHIFINWPEKYRDDTVMDKAAKYGNLFDEGMRLGAWILEQTKIYYSKQNDDTILDPPDLDSFKDSKYPICKSFAYQTLTLEGNKICSLFVATDSTYQVPEGGLEVSTTPTVHSCRLGATWMGCIPFVTDPSKTDTNDIKFLLGPLVNNCKVMLYKKNLPDSIWAYLSDEKRSKFLDEAKQIVSEIEAKVSVSIEDNNAKMAQDELVDQLSSLCTKTLGELQETTNGRLCKIPLRTDKLWEELTSPIFKLIHDASIEGAEWFEDLERIPGGGFRHITRPRDLQIGVWRQ